MWLLPRKQESGTALTSGSRKPRAPLPKVLPGDFFVLAWDRDREVFTLVVDDADESDYNLGGDIQKVMRHFDSWKLKEIGYRAIDAAHEWGMVQVIPTEDRIIRLSGRDPVDTVSGRLQALEEQEHGNVRHLPNLRSSV